MAYCSGININSDICSFKWNQTAIRHRNTDNCWKVWIFWKLSAVNETALSDLTEVYVGCSVDQTNQSDFNDHSALFNYLGNRLLQICNTFQRYTFIIWIDSDENLIANSIASILELPQIIHCERVNIGLGAFLLDQPIQLPIESISSWLVGMGIPEEEIKIRKKGQKRFLKISSDRISNAQQICEHLKEVNFQFHSIQLFIILVIHRAHVGIISR